MGVSEYAKICITLLGNFIRIINKAGEIVYLLKSALAKGELTQQQKNLLALALGSQALCALSKSTRLRSCASLSGPRSIFRKREEERSGVEVESSEGR